MKIIETENAPRAIGTYSQAIESNGFLFISGQIPLDPSTMELVEGIENQIKQVFQNIKQILKANDMDFSNIVKLSVLLEDLNNFRTGIVKTKFSEGLWSDFIIENGNGQFSLNGNEITITSFELRNNDDFMQFNGKATITHPK